MREQWQWSEIKSVLAGTSVAVVLVVLCVGIALAIWDRIILVNPGVPFLSFLALRLTFKVRREFGQCLPSDTIESLMRQA